MENVVKQGLNMVWQYCRQPIRILLRLILAVDGWLTWHSTRWMKRPFSLEGSCLKRGICCHNIAIGLKSPYYSNKVAKWLTVQWYAFVYNFQAVGKNDDHQVLIFKCNYLKNKQCSIYNTRPYFCRRYPNSPKFFEKPTLLPGCGYRLSDPSKT